MAQVADNQYASLSPDSHKGSTESLPQRKKKDKKEQKDATPEAHGVEAPEVVPQAVENADTTVGASKEWEAAPKPKGKQVREKNAMKASLKTAKDLSIQLERDANALILDRKKRVSTLGGWCRQMDEACMEQPRLYAAEDEGEGETFTEVFVRTNALESVIEGFLLDKENDETFLLFLFTHALYGDSPFHQQLLGSLSTLSTAMRGHEPQVASAIAQSVAAAVGEIKFSAGSARRAKQMVLKIDTQIGHFVNRLNSISDRSNNNDNNSNNNNNNRNKQLHAAEASSVTKQLLKLSVDRQKILSRVVEHIRTPDQLASVVEKVQDNLKMLRDQTEVANKDVKEKFSEWEKTKTESLAPEEAAVNEAMALREELAKEAKALQEEKKQMEQELQQVRKKIDEVERKRTANNSVYAKAADAYNAALKKIGINDTGIAKEMEKVKKALDSIEKSEEYFTSLNDSVTSAIEQCRRETEESILKGAQVQKDFVKRHLQSTEEEVLLVQRRVNFMTKEVLSMKTQMDEAKDLGLGDVAGNLRTLANRIKSSWPALMIQYERTVQELPRLQEFVKVFVDSTLQATKEGSIGDAFVAEIQQMVTRTVEAADDIGEKVSKHDAMMQPNVVQTPKK